MGTDLHLHCDWPERDALLKTSSASTDIEDMPVRYIAKYQPEPVYKETHNRKQFNACSL